ncbi:MAG: hypothetical protein HeimC2_20480 [Candidatus Heimdallarchaeota archaeon LC_2]|nr:MAG: hypothetical protein HeimC2_20480 [Candidatus Heimdallarchaeota archaeon LC_2]
MINLADLLSRLKKLGFKISISETLDANRLLLEAESQLEVRFGLRMILSKSKQEQDLFDLVWENLMAPIKPENLDDSGELTDNSNQSDKGNGDERPPSKNSQETEMQGAAFGRDGSNALAIALSRSASDYKGIVRQLLGGNDRNAAAIMLRYMLVNSMNVIELMNKSTEIRKGVEGLLEQLTNDLSVREFIPGDTEYYLEQLDASLKLILKEHLTNPPNIHRYPLKVEDIKDLPLVTLKSSAELQHALRILGKKLATKQRRKRRSGARKINLRQTIRKNIQHGGVLLELKRHQPRLTRSKLILMTDVSPSTIQATRMFLSIIWNAKEVFGDIQYYEFIGSCINVTNEFRRAKSVNDGMEDSLARWKREIGGKENSDYYSAFRILERETRTKLTKQVSLVILGDMRDWLGPWKDGKPMSSRILGEIRKKVNRIIVLNPEPKRMWNTGDSICRYCEDQGLEVYETTNLGQLIECLLQIN